ncbi:Lcl C-terminal domain-containing protein [Sulfurimonas sp.]
MIKTVIGLTLTTAMLSAWFVPNFSFGGNNNDNTHVDKNFQRDDKKGVVIDTKNSRMYYDSKPSNRMHFFAAWDYCKKMDYLGHNDWRVASKEEYRSLLELSRRTLMVKHAFKNVKEERYWTSTDDRFDQAWYFDFDLGRYSTQKYTHKYRTICVRDSK